MNKLLVGAIGMALVMALLLTGTSYKGPHVAYAQGMVNFDIDPLVAEDDDADGLTNDGCPASGAAESGAQCANLLDDDLDGRINDGCPIVGTAETACGNQRNILGTVQDCVRVDVTSPVFDGIDDDADTVINDGCPAAGPDLDEDTNPDPETACNDAVDDDRDGFVNDGCPVDGAAETACDTGSEYLVDIVVTGDTQAPTAYDANLNFDPTKVHIAAPGTNALIKMPAGSEPSPPTLPKTTSPVAFGGYYPSGGPGTPGSGTIVRVGLDIGASGVVTFSLNGAPLTAYKSGLGIHCGTTAPPTPECVRDIGKLAINENCPLPQADLKILSQALIDKEPDDPVTGVCGGTPPTSININEHEWLCLEKVIHNNGPETTAVNITKTGAAVEADGTVSYHCEGTETNAVVDGITLPCPAGMVHVGRVIVVHETTPALPPSVTLPVVEQWDVSCGAPSQHTFTFDNLIAPVGSITDPIPGNNTAHTAYVVDCLASSDIKITSFAAVWAGWKVDSDGDTIADLAVVSVSTPTNVILRTGLHNNGPYGPTEVKLSKTAMVYPAPGYNTAATVTPATDEEQSTLVVSNATTVDETFQIHCLDAGTAKVTLFRFTNTVTPKDPHIIDSNGAIATPVMLPVLCVPRFQPTFVATIENDDNTMVNPASDVCVLNKPCKTLSSVDIPVDLPYPAQQPLALIQTIWPAALDIAPGTAANLGLVVGKSDFSVNAHLVDVTEWDCTGNITGTAIQFDACLPTDCPTASGTTLSTYALFPPNAPPVPPSYSATAFWSQQLNAILPFVASKYPGATLWAHYVGAAAVGAAPGIPINVLVWKLQLPAGHPLILGGICPDTTGDGIGDCWLVIGQTGLPDNDLDGSWDDVLDADDDNDGVPDGRPRDDPQPHSGICTGGNNGLQCINALDDDADTVVNDGCPAKGAAETACADAIDDDADTKVNDGCVKVGAVAETPCYDNCPVKGNATQLDSDGDLVGDACELLGKEYINDPSDKPTFTCSPYSSDTLSLGEALLPLPGLPYYNGPTTPDPTVMRTCTVFGVHTVWAMLTRTDTGETKYLSDTISCIETKTDLEVSLYKNEDIVVPEDLVHSETVDVIVYNNGAAPTDYTVQLTQVSTKRDKCVSHLVPVLPGDTLHEFTVGNQFYSKLSWTEPELGAYATRTSSRNYTILCSVPVDALTGYHIEQFVVDVDPITMDETHEIDNTAENHVSVVTDPDIDDDTIPNVTDNCPYDKNPLQEECALELNPDGIGDICDTDDDNDGILDVDDDCDCLPGIAGPHPNNGCPMSDVSIDVLKLESVNVDRSVSTPYDVKVIVTNPGPAGPVDVDLLLVSPNPADNDPVMDEGCIVSWKDAQAGLSFVEEVIQDPPGQYKLHSLLSGQIAMAADDSEELNLKAYIHCYEKSDHVDAFELAAGVAPLPPIWDDDSANNIHKNWPDVTAWETADVKKVSFAVVSPPTNIDVSANVPVTLRAVIHNNGPYGPVDITDEMIAGLPPTDCTVSPTSQFQVVNGVPVSTDIVIDKVFTIHCSKPSTHGPFTWTDNVAVLTPHVKDADGNNHATTPLTVNAIAKADVKIISQSWLTPPGQIAVSANVPVTLRKVLHNNGALPVTVTVTKVADAPPDCTITPTQHSLQVVLPPSSDVTVDEVFTIHCKNPSEHTFEVENTVSGPKEAHVVDPDLSNNISAKLLTVVALGQADIKVTGVVAVPALLKVPPVVNNAVTAETTIHNNGPMVANSLKTVKVYSPSAGGGTCSINGAMYSPVTIVDAAPEVDQVSVTLVELDNFTVDLPLGTATCRFAVNSSKALTGAHMGDPVPGNNSAWAQGLVCRDRDTLLCPGPSPCPDTVADPEASAEEAECGPPDNCPDHYNPDQADTDGDGLGDVCDPSRCHDVLVKSLLLFGPAPVNLSDTTGHYMWAIGEIGMKPECAHTETVELSLTIDPDGVAGCVPDPFAPQLILPGHNPFRLMAGEQKWVLYRTRFECHAPGGGLPGIYPLDIELCIEHLAHDPPSGDEALADLANNCQSRVKSLLLQ